jgi:hypothetical protein
MVVNMRYWVHNLAVWCYAHVSSGRIGVLAEKIGRASRLVFLLRARFITALVGVY